MLIMNLNKKLSKCLYAQETYDNMIKPQFYWLLFLLQQKIEKINKKEKSQVLQLLEPKVEFYGCGKLSKCIIQVKYKDSIIDLWSNTEHYELTKQSCPYSFTDVFDKWLDTVVSNASHLLSKMCNIDYTIPAQYVQDDYVSEQPCYIDFEEPENLKALVDLSLPCTSVNIKYGCMEIIATIMKYLVFGTSKDFLKQQIKEHEWKL